MGPTYGDSAAGLEARLSAGQRTHTTLRAMRSGSRHVLVALLARRLRCRPVREPLRLVALGDSLTAGLGLEPQGCLSRQARGRACAPGASMSRWTTPGCRAIRRKGALQRLDWAVDADADAVIVELGANDALRGRRSERNARQPRGHRDQAARSAASPVLLAGMQAPPNLGRPYARGFRRRFILAIAGECRRCALRLLPRGRGRRAQPQSARWHAPQRRRASRRSSGASCRKWKSCSGSVDS